MAGRRPGGRRSGGRRSGGGVAGSGAVMSTIHPTAIVDPKAELDASVEVGPYSVVGPHVRIGPGDQLKMDVEIVRVSRGIWKYKAVGSVDGAVAVEADLMCTIRATNEPSSNASQPAG